MIFSVNQTNLILK